MIRIVRCLAFALFATIAGLAQAQEGPCEPRGPMQPRHLVLLASYQDAEREIRDVRFSPDGSLLAMAANDGYAQVRDVATGDIVMRTRRFETPIWYVGFSQDGGQVVTYVTGDGPDHLYVWDIATGEGRVTRDASISYGLMTAPDYSATSPDGTRSFVDGRLFDPRTNTELASIRSPIRNATPLFSSDSSVLVIGAPYESRVFDARTGELTTRLCGTNNSVPARISADAQFFASLEQLDDRESLSVAIWDTRTGAVIARLWAPLESIWALDVSPDGRLLATGSTDGSVRVWRITDGVGETPEIQEADLSAGVNWMRLSSSDTVLVAVAVFSIVLIAGLALRRRARK